jgi:fucose permease
MNRRVATFICYAAITMFAIAMTITSPLLGEMSFKFSVSIFETGVIFTASFVGFVIFTIWGGVMADKRSKKVVLSTALLGFGIALLIFPLTTNFLVACIIMMFIGGFGGVIESQISAIVADLNPDKPEYYINLVQVFFGLGALIGPIAAGLLVYYNKPWELCYYITGVLTLVIAVFFIRIRLLESTDESRISFNTFKGLITDRKFLLLCICMMFYTGAEVGSWGWICTFLEEEIGFTTIKSSIALGLFWISITVGRLICGGLTFRYSTRSLVIALSFLSSIATGLCALVASEFLAWVVIVFMGLSFSSVWPLIVGYGGQKYKKSSGTAFAVLVASGGAGSMIIPYSMGLVSERAGLRAGMISPVILFLLVAVIFATIENNWVNKNVERIDCE